MKSRIRYWQYLTAEASMILNGNAAANIRQCNALSSPEFLRPDGTLETFDYAVANPPFLTKSWRNGLDPENDVYGRFQGFGILPAKNRAYAFLLHFIHSLKITRAKVQLYFHTEFSSGECGS